MQAIRALTVSATGKSLQTSQEYDELLAVVSQLKKASRRMRKSLAAGVSHTP
jgi:hypothetical protein